MGYLCCRIGHAEVVIDELYANRWDDVSIIVYMQIFESLQYVRIIEPKTEAFGSQSVFVGKLTLRFGNDFTHSYSRVAEMLTVCLSTS